MGKVLDRMQAITDGPALARVCVLALAMLCVAQTVRIALLLVAGPVSQHRQHGLGHQPGFYR